MKYWKYILCSLLCLSVSIVAIAGDRRRTSIVRTMV